VHGLLIAEAESALAEYGGGDFALTHNDFVFRRKA
jgi:hypothetical protein